MNFKKLGAPILPALLVGAILASSASAAATTTAAQWYTGTGTGTTLSGGQGITVDLGLGKTFSLRGVVAGKAVTLTATGVECLSCFITNSEVTSKAGKAAFGQGQIRFTGVTADLPRGCTVREKETGPAGTITTKNLVVHADWMIGSVAYQQFLPESGSVLATVFLEGGECEAIEGIYSVTGTLFSEATFWTGTQTDPQSIAFSSAIQAATGGALKLGSNAAEFSGIGWISTGGTPYGIH
jgi:hypothetical protein